MDAFMRQQGHYVGTIRRAVRRDLCLLRLLDKEEVCMRLYLKRNIHINLCELDRCAGIMDWVLDRPDDAGSFIIKV